MDAQKIFDTVATHLFAQGKRAFDEKRDSCSYRGPDNTTCAVGCLIPNEAYMPDMETHNVGYVLTRYKEKLPQLTPHEGLLTALQMAHDDQRHWFTTETMRKTLREIGEVYRLNTGILDTLSFGDR